MTKELIFSMGPDHPTIRRDTFRSGGKGGQNQNKVESGVRFTHLPTKSVGESREHRTQHQNEREAWKKLVAQPAFTFWLIEEAKRANGEKNMMDQIEKELADPAVTRVEVMRDGEWSVE